MIKIHEDMTYGEFKKIIKDHQCKLIFKHGSEMYIDPHEEINHDIFASVDMVEILDAKLPTIADKAKQIIYGDREKTYGDPGKNVQCVADMWSGYLGIPITSNDVCNMLCLLKIARLRNTPGHADSMVDLIGYTLLQERIINKC